MSKSQPERPSSRAKPFLKWAGGKSRIASTICELFPVNFNDYYEPFLGSGAVYFKISHQSGVLNDANKKLIMTYKAIKKDPEALIREMSKMETEYNSFSNLEEKKKYYYKIREKFNSNNNTSKMPAQFIFLNKAGWNGMYRENSKGEFNIPFGKREVIKIFDEDTILKVSKDLQRITFKCGDYKNAVLNAKSGDLIYFDPPYIPLSKTSFTDYQKDGFGKKEQIELRDLAIELSERGCYVAISNSDCDESRKLYEGFHIKKIPIMRTIGAKNASRKKITEILATNYCKK